MKPKLQCICICMTAMLLLTAALTGCSAPQQSGGASSSASTQSVAMEPIELGKGLVLSGLSAASGGFPEDGSDTPVDNMLCAVFTNSGKSTLQYASVGVILNGTPYSFELTTIPPGKSVYAFDLDMQPAPESISSVSAAAEYLVLFPEEPTLDPQRLEITVTDGKIAVKNISGEKIDKDVFVYYKRVVDGTYLGGITYRARIGTLGVGQETVGFSSHAGKDTELMFVTYGN